MIDKVSFNPNAIFGSKNNSISSENNAKSKSVTPSLNFNSMNKLGFNSDFVSDYETQIWKYQDFQSVLNQTTNLNEYSKNLSSATRVLNEFNSKYPNMDSYTMADAKLKNKQRTEPNSSDIEILQKQSDILFEKMKEILDKRPNSPSDITFDEYINMVKQEFRDYKFANCGERAYVIYDELNKKGIKNHAVIEISGKENYNSHVFNVVGLAPNANPADPKTWGNNAIVVDAWTNKVYSPQDAINYYKEFLGYSKDNPMQFQQDNPDKIFKRQ